MLRASTAVKEFMGTEQELRELASLPELGVFEWKELGLLAERGHSGTGP